MDAAKIRSAITAVKTVVTEMVNAEAKTLVEPKSDATAKLAAARGLNVLGRINNVMTTAEERVEKALKRLTPRAKKKKTPKPAATTGK